MKKTFPQELRTTKRRERSSTTQNNSRERDLIFIAELNEIYEFQRGDTEQCEMEPILSSPQGAGTRERGAGFFEHR